MLSFFRRIINSRLGVIITLGVIGIIALAFAAGDVTGLRPGGSTGSSATIATVGDQKITEKDVQERLKTVAEYSRRNGQPFNVQDFLQQGGLETVIKQMIDSAALTEYARKNGVFVNKRIIDGEIASIPAFQGVDGKFDQQAYERLLRERRVTETALRDDIRTEKYGNWLMAPVIGASQVPDQLALPYASLLLERRQGDIAFIPTAAMPEPATPDDKALTAYYQANIQRYSLPERRVVRYAEISAETLKAQSAPTDAQIAEAYRAAGDRFQAKETRSIEQVIVADQATAEKFAAQVKAGRSIADVARAAGLEPSQLTDLTKQGMTRGASADVANAVFAANEGAVIGPVRSSLGWAVLRVTRITKVPAKSLEQAKAELIPELSAENLKNSLSKLHDDLDDGIADEKTFDELVKSEKLTPETTPALTAEGMDPSNPQYHATPVVLQALRAGFTSEVGDTPQLVPVDKDGSFAVVALDRVVAAAPRPLKDVREQVLADYKIEQALKAARKAAAQVVAAINKGTSVKDALAATGYRLPAPQPLDIARAQLRNAGAQLPPQVALLFRMTEKKAKLQEAPNSAGYFIVYLDKIESHDASGDKAAIAAARSEIAGSVGREYTAEMVDAIRRSLNVKRNEAVIADLRKQLASQGVAGN